VKRRHEAGARANARATLELLNIAIGQDFHILSSDQVSGLLGEADRVRYRRPPNANGSRARYFHDRLQRHASLKKD
jgi:hypothetical protein